MREAVAYLCRYTFQQDLALIFGAHPAISPMALDIARRFVPSSPEKQVIIFHSAFFRPEDVSRATLDLANWDAGELLWTAPRPTRDAKASSTCAV